MNIYQSYGGVSPTYSTILPTPGEVGTVMGQAPNEGPKDGQQLTEGHTAADLSLLTSTFFLALTFPRPPHQRGDSRRLG